MISTEYIVNPCFPILCLFFLQIYRPAHMRGAGRLFSAYWCCNLIRVSVASKIMRRTFLYIQVNPPSGI